MGTVTVYYSLVEDGSCGVTNGVNGNKTGDPNLGALTGSPAYFPLNAGSIAVNSGSNSLLSEATTGVDYNGDGDFVDSITTDQAGNARIVSGTVDIGAFESAFSNTAPTLTTPPSATPTLTVTATLTPTLELTTLPTALLFPTLDIAPTLAPTATPTAAATEVPQPTPSATAAILPTVPPTEAPTALPTADATEAVGS